MTFHERLKELRSERNFTQQKLGTALGYGSSAIANYESGRNQPSITDLIKMSRLFNVTTDYLLGITDSPQPSSEFLSPTRINDISTLLAQQFSTHEKELSEMFRPILSELLHNSTSESEN